MDAMCWATMLAVTGLALYTIGVMIEIYRGDK